MIQLSINIPKEFFSEKTGEKFTNCIYCGKSLDKSEHGYFIEKAYNNNPKTNETEIIFEYAICLDCIQETQNELSEKSLKNIQMYFKLYTKNKNIAEDDLLNTKKRITNCFITNKPVSSYKEYQIAGFFIDDCIIFTDLYPLSIGEYAIEEIQELISDKTRDYLDKFKDKVIPPSVREFVPDGRVVFI